jgi:RNA polymerase sigma-70 factor (ECF subfamily)
MATHSSLLPALASGDLYRELVGFLIRKIRCREQACDIAQESLTKVLESSQLGTVIREPRALLFEVARHLVVDHSRHASVVVKHSEAVRHHAWAVQTEVSAEYRAACKQALAIVVAALNALPERPRQMFLMMRVHQYSRDEVARVFGASPAAVAKMVVRTAVSLAPALEAARQAMPEPEPAIPTPVMRAALESEQAA